MMLSTSEQAERYHRDEFLRRVAAIEERA